MVVACSEVAVEEMERGGWISGVFCRTVNVLDMKNQKGSIKNNNKIFGLGNQMVLPFAWIRKTEEVIWGRDKKIPGNQKFCVSLR